MAIEVIFPKVDMDMVTGRLSRWLVAEGAAVKQGDPLFEIETDKAAMEIEAPGTGILRDVRAPEGADVAVGEAVAWIFAEGEQSAAKPVSVATAGPRLKPVAVEVAVPASVVETPASGGGIRATPLARRIAREAGIALSQISGSGPHGRIVRADVEDAVTALTKVQVPGSGVAHDTMRQTIARRLVMAKSTVPHFYLSADCRLDALLKLRAEINAAALAAYKVSINDMVIKAWALALRDVPMANVSWREAAMLCHAHADIAVAVSVPGGLITPIIRHAETKSLTVISNEMKDLAARARTRKLKAEEYRGGTSAISNLGMYGVRDFAAIINPPHATILAVGAGEPRAVVANGAIVAAMVMTVTLSTDHRAVDGALAAEALAAFRNYIENPLRMVV